jgi:hypothetical protein
MAWKSFAGERTGHWTQQVLLGSVSFFVGFLFACAFGRPRLPQILDGVFFGFGRGQYFLSITGTDT